MIKYLDLKKINDLHDSEIRQAMDKVLDSGWYLKGEATRRFEQHYAEYIGTKYCIGCGNGLDALTLIFRAYMEMGVMQEGDEVIVPANTYIASILAITECGLKPVLVEPKFDTLQIDEDLIENAITDRTRAVLIVHLYGFCAYTQKIADICYYNHLKLIEDNAQAHGCCFVESGGVPHRPLKLTGSLGDAAGHSFYPGKNLGALGDAGAVTTNDEELARVVESLGNYGSSRKYVFDYIGRNSRMDELQAAILDVKLSYLPQDNDKRADRAHIYINKVKNPNIIIPDSYEERCRTSAWHIFPVFSPCRDRLQAYLKENGVETMIHYPIPPHKQLCYKEWNTLELPITELIHEQELSIPCHQALTYEEVDLIVDLLNSF